MHLVIRDQHGIQHCFKSHEPAQATLYLCDDGSRYTSWHWGDAEVRPEGQAPAPARPAAACVLQPLLQAVDRRLHFPFDKQLGMGTREQACAQLADLLRRHAPLRAFARAFYQVLTRTVAAPEKEADPTPLGQALDRVASLVGGEGPGTAAAVGKQGLLLATSCDQHAPQAPRLFSRWVFDKPSCAFGDQQACRVRCYLWSTAEGMQRDRAKCIREVLPCPPASQPLGDPDKHTAAMRQRPQGRLVPCEQQRRATPDEWDQYEDVIDFWVVREGTRWRLCTTQVACSLPDAADRQRVPCTVTLPDYLPDGATPHIEAALAGGVIFDGGALQGLELACVPSPTALYHYLAVACQTAPDQAWGTEAVRRDLAHSRCGILLQAVARDMAGQVRGPDGHSVAETSSRCALDPGFDACTRWLYQDYLAFARKHPLEGALQDHLAQWEEAVQRRFLDEQDPAQLRSQKAWHLSWFSRRLQQLLELEAFVRQHPQQAQRLLQALRNPQLLDGQGMAALPHAAIRVVAQLASEGVATPYVGMAQPCCAMCCLAIRQWGLQGRGSTDQAASWPLPRQLVQDETLVATFLGPEAYAAYQALPDAMMDCPLPLQEAGKEASQACTYKEAALLLLGAADLLGYDAVLEVLGLDRPSLALRSASDRGLGEG